MKHDSTLAKDDSRHDILHQSFAEVEPVPEHHSVWSKVGEDRLLVSRFDFFNRLEFHHPLATIHVPISLSCLSVTLWLRVIIGREANSMVCWLARVDRPPNQRRLRSPTDRAAGKLRVVAEEDRRESDLGTGCDGALC